MWVDYREAPNLVVAEMWKDVLEGEGPSEALAVGAVVDGVDGVAVGLETPIRGAGRKVPN